MLKAKKDFIEKTKAEHGYSGRITGFSRCAKCGGACCKVNSCACVPADFEDLSVEGIERALDTGNYMITAVYRNASKEGIPFIPVPFLAAREVGAPENGVNITMVHSMCALLGDDGCILSEDERPSQGLLLIPKEEDQCVCYVNAPGELWFPYREVFDEVIRKRTGKTAQDFFEEEAEPLAHSIEEKIRDAIMNEGYITKSDYLIAKAMLFLGMFNYFLGATDTMLIRASMRQIKLQ